MSLNNRNLVTITFIQSNGDSTVVEDRVGLSVMDFAVDHGVPGIQAQCGGACICTTCLCDFDEVNYQLLESPTADELEMLSFVPQRQPRYRLSCQIEASDNLNGLRVLVPAESEEM